MESSSVFEGFGIRVILQTHGVWKTGAPLSTLVPIESSIASDYSDSNLSAYKKICCQRPFQSLAIVEKSGRCAVPGSINDEKCIPIHNEYFSGKVLVMLREPDGKVPEQFREVFEGRNRMFEVQVQGKFNQPPNGDLYIGIEIGEEMKLGLLSMAICNSFLSFAKRLNKYMHYSFGTKDNSELPHISFPLITNVDSLIITPPDQQPPKLGKKLLEDPKAKKRRIASTGFGEFEMDYTYTFSFHSMYLNIANWTTCKIPMVRDMDLHTFWGQSPLRITAYTITPSGSLPGDKVVAHTQKNISYLACIEIEHFDSESKSEGNESSEQEQGYDMASKQTSGSKSRSFSGSYRLSTYSACAGSDSNKSNDSDDDSFYSANADYSVQRGVSAYINNGVKDVSIASNGYELAVCPSYLDIYGKNAKKHKGTSFVVVRGQSIVLRQSKHFSRFLSGLWETPKISESLSPRISQIEKDRLRFNILLRYFSISTNNTKNMNQLKEFMAFTSSEDKFFSKHKGTQRNASVLNISKRLTSSLPSMEGMVIRAISEHHWSEEMASVTDNSFILQRQRQTVLCIDKHNLIRVALSDVDSSDLYLPGFTNMEIHTLGRVHHFMIPTPAQARDWVLVLSNMCCSSALSVKPRQPNKSVEGSSSNCSSPSVNGDDEYNGNLQDPHPYSSYLLRSSKWRGRNRYILNCRRLHALSSDQISDSHPVTVIGDLLKQALELSTTGLGLLVTSKESGGYSGLVEFLDATTNLRWMNLNSVTEHDEQLAMFLNLYHLMILHAYLLVGPPGSALKCASYFTSLSYEIGGDVISMVELEHAVLRAPLSSPRQFFAKFIFPTWKYSFSLTKPEPRISFVLNCGTESGVTGIMVYSPKNIDRQLDLMSRYFLSNTVEVIASKLTVILPKVLYWFKSDFGNSNIDALRAIVRYMSGSKYNALVSMLAVSDTTSITIKFHPFSWKCKSLSPVTNEELRDINK